MDITQADFLRPLTQQASLRRCLSEPVARLDNNPVERAIRPLKIGARNWLFIGHPDAGPRHADRDRHERPVEGSDHLPGAERRSWRPRRRRCTAATHATPAATPR